MDASNPWGKEEKVDSERRRESSVPWRLFAFGSNGSGQLGIGHADDVAIPRECLFDQDELRQLDINDRISKVATGGNHSLVLFKSGAVFSAGKNQDGRCGFPTNLPEMTIFRRVRIRGSQNATGREISHFVDVAASWEASYFVTTENAIWVCGSGTKGELGLGQSVTQCSLGQQCLELSSFRGGLYKIAMLRGCLSHLVAMTDSGEIFGWGSARKGQLGPLSRHEKVIWSPVRLPLHFQPVNLVTGRDFTLLSDGETEWVLWGDDRFLNGLDTGHDNTTLVAGWSNVYMLSNRRVLAFGRNDRGQIPSKSLPDLTMMAAGSEHCVGVTVTGDVVSWGWGEHGNCGLPVDNRGNVADRWNVLPLSLGPGERIANIAAGCATSYLIVEVI